MTPAVAVLGGWGGGTGKPREVQGAAVSGFPERPPTPAPRAFCGNFDPGGRGQRRCARAGRRLWDAAGSVRRKVPGPDWASGRVIAGSRRGDPGALFVQLSLPFVGSGGDRGPGGGEARGSEAGPRILESPEWGGPKLRGGVRRFPLGWTGQGAPGGRYVRGARGARGGETSGSGSASSGLAACTDQKPARLVLL